MNKAEFVARATKIHGARYNYDTVDYRNYRSKVSISCLIHGIFYQTAAEHLRGCGCPRCAHNKQKLNLADFINRARQIHTTKYDYNLVRYKNIRTKVTIICPKHGAFQQSPLVHFNGSGCPRCQDIVNSTQRFIVKARNIHGSTYDYSLVAYTNHHTPVTIVCTKHGPFSQRTRNHLAGAGCPTCAQECCLISKQEFITKSNTIHANKYLYDKVQYLGSFTNVVITCPIHGDFTQLPSNHLRGSGCPECMPQRQRATTADFVTKAHTIHSSKYDYSESIYRTAFDKVVIRCPQHGEFKQRANNHLCGQGCPRCPTIISTGQRNLKRLIPAEIEIIDNDRTVLSPYEIDIYLPEHKIGIEYHGDYWHSQSRHRTVDKYSCLRKHEKAVAQNLKLLQFFEHEINDSIIKSMIEHHLGLSTRVAARKCSLSAINHKQAKQFFDTNHLFGYRPARYTYALIYADVIVIALSLSKHTTHQYEIIRLATACGFAVLGGFSRLLKHFIRVNTPHNIMTFADKRFSDGKVYNRNGFQLIGHTKPNYRYIDLNSKRVLSRYQCQKHKLTKLLGQAFDPTLSESENMFNNNFGKIWDAGHYQFSWPH